MNACSVDCGAKCCRKWWITLLPEELDLAAGEKRVPRKQFIEDYCVLFAELIPLEEMKDGIVVFNELLPKSIAKEVESELGKVPDFFLALPFIAFRRVNENCVFLDEGSHCSIYAARPKQCELFPALSHERGKTQKESYGFCALAGSEKSGLDEEHFNKTKHYFSEVEGRGFSRVLHNLPALGIIKIRSRVFTVSRGDFLGLLGPYA